MIYMIRGWGDDQNSVIIMEGPPNQELGKLYKEFCLFDVEPLKSRAEQFAQWLKRSRKWRIVKPPVFHIRDDDDDL